jgi:Protein of unknown function (DUF3617)
MRCKCSNLLPVCALTLFLVGSSTLFAQVADLPIKAGLWDAQSNTKIVSSQGNHEMPVTTQDCFTAGLTLADYMTALNRAAAREGKCAVSNRVQTAHGISFDSACTGPTMSSKGHADFKLADADHFNGSSHTTLTGSMNGAPINMTIDKTFSAKFVSSNCGNVEPTVISPASGK